MRKKTSRIRSLLATSELDVLMLIGDESRRKGTNVLSSRQIDRVINSVRIKSNGICKERERPSQP
jgi:hypothetical protein